MLLNKEQINLIKNNKVTFIKNFVLLTREYDFNLLSKLMEENECKINQKLLIGNLKDVFQMLKVSNFLQEFKVFFDFLSKYLKWVLLMWI